MALTFTYSATSVVLNGCEFETSLPAIEFRQTMDEAEDGTVYVYDKTARVWLFELRLKLTNTQRSALRSFFKTTVQGSKLAFSLTPPPSLDLGKGAGTQLTNVRLWQGEYTERPVRGGSRWLVSLILRTNSTGTGSPA